MATKKLKRQYGVDAQGNKIPSVTEIIGENLGWSKSALMGWAYKLGREKRSMGERDVAAAKGSAVHDIVSERLGGEVALMDASLREECEPNASRVFDAIMECDWEILHTELLMRCETFGGTCDLIARGANGTTGIVDIKTGKGVYDEVVIQLAAYSGLYETVRDTGKVLPITWGAVVHAPFGGVITVKQYTLPQLLAGGEIFAALLRIHTMRDALGGDS